MLRYKGLSPRVHYDNGGGGVEDDLFYSLKTSVVIASFYK